MGTDAARRAELTGHGLCEPAVVALLRLHARRLIERTRRRNCEHAVMLDADSGDQLGEELAGDRFSVDLAPHFRAMRAGHSYVAVHTHPSDCGFSLADGAILHRFTAVRLVIVLGGRGTWYVLSRTGERPLLPWDRFVAAFESEHDARAPAYERAIRDGSTSRRVATCERVNGVWQVIAANCGLLYTRIERGGD